MFDVCNMFDEGIIADIAENLFSFLKTNLHCPAKYFQNIYSASRY